MKRIEIKKIVIEGFRNISNPLTFNIDTSGIFILRGSNGSGKTSLFEALFWGLFGMNLKNTYNEDITTWEENRSIDFKGTKVEVHFVIEKDNYVVIRCLNYEGIVNNIKGKNNLFVFKNGTIYTGVHKKDNQQIINDILGMDHRIFMNSVLFGQRIDPFINTSNNDKRELFEKLFEAQFIKEAKEYSKDKQYKLNEELNNKKVQLSNLKSELDSLNYKLSSIEEYNKKAVQLHQQNIEKAENKLQDITNKISNTKISLQNLEDKYSELKVNLGITDYDENTANENLLKYKQKIRDNENEINAYEKNKYEYQTILNDLNNINKNVDKINKTILEINNKFKQYKEKLNVCPFCGQPIKEDLLEKLSEKYYKENFESQEQFYKNQLQELTYKTKVYEQLLNECEEKNKDKDIEVLKEENKRLQALIDEINKQKNSILSNKKTLENYETSIQNQKNLLSSLQILRTEAEKELQNAKDEPVSLHDVEPVKTQIKEYEQLIQEKEAEIINTSSLIERVTWWASIGFGSKGLSSYVFKSMLNDLNNIIDKYASRLGVSIKFFIDIDQTSKPFKAICSLGNKKNKYYEEFSGGEKRRLDIIIMFAFHEFISRNNNINILIMDEVFEGLDEEGETIVFDLIRYLSEKGKTIYIITHSNKIDGLYCTTINVFKDDKGNLKINKV